MENTFDSEDSVRFCGGTWVYCNGDCEKCIGARYIISTHTDGLLDDSSLLNTTDTSGEKMYL